MKTKLAALAVPVALGAAAVGISLAAPSGDQRSVERGRYLITVAGCNDCHTAGYMAQGGKVPEAEWLAGVPVGFQGPWGTTYPANLRNGMQSLDEEAWLKKARSPMRPPMPWFNLAAMTDDDLRAIYRYVQSLGPKGDPAPGYVAPGEKVSTPYFLFVPQNLPPQAHASTK
jgi:mono/diheme cytochrome c family protein